jgi:hypothetical protein
MVYAQRVTLMLRGDRATGRKKKNAPRSIKSEARW